MLDLTSLEFFIKKTIEWALREHSKTDPIAVQKFVDGTELTSLCRRETLKVLIGTINAHQIAV